MNRHTNLTLGTVYYYKAAATNAVGTGPFSVMANISTAAGILFYLISL